MLFAGLTLRLRAALHRAGYSLIGLLFLAVGIAFFVLAAWLMLATSRGAIFASVVMGALFVGAGLIALGLANRLWVRVPLAPVPLVAPGPRPLGYAMPALMEAFIVGITAGLAANAGRKRGRPADRD